MCGIKNLTDLPYNGGIALQITVVLYEFAYCRRYDNIIDTVMNKNSCSVPPNTDNR